MAINSVQIQWRRAFVMSAAVALAACSSSSTTNDGGQNVGGSGGTTLPSGSTAGLDAAVGSTQFDDSATAPLTSGFTWNECEIYNSTICGTWAWNGASNQFSATWANGAQALMTLVEND
jgi:hypothetical protein